MRVLFSLGTGVVFFLYHMPLYRSGYIQTTANINAVREGGRLEKVYEVTTGIKYCQKGN